MTRHIVLAVPGLDPVRILRVANTLAGTDLVVPITASADHWTDELAGLLREMGLTPRIHRVQVEEWLFADALAALRDALGSLVRDGDLFDVVIGGGTKPMAAAVGVVAEEFGARTWVLDEWHGVLVGDEKVPLVEPSANLSPQGLAQLFSVHHVVPKTAGGDDESFLEWLRGHFAGRVGGRGGDTNDLAKTFESAVVALLRAVLPDDYEVWGPQEFVLRDPLSPTAPAIDPRNSDPSGYRRFEVDGIVVRGTRMWIVESKFIGKELTQSRMRTAYAELNRRRLDIGGFTAVGVLVVLNDRQAESTPEGPVDAFTPAGIEVLGRVDLVAALEAIDTGDWERISATEVARVFRQ